MKKLLLGAAVLTLAFAFAGCGAAEEPAADVDTPVAGVEAVTEETSVEGETLVEDETSVEDETVVEDETSVEDETVEATTVVAE
jgi:hypothetical protein